MKQYKLLKDLPGVKAGAITKLKDGKIIVESDNTDINLDKCKFEIYPDFFELVEPKEFTESQVKKAIEDYFDRVFKNTLYLFDDSKLAEIINDLRK